jgi:hypothetical protein
MTRDSLTESLVRRRLRWLLLILTATLLASAALYAYADSAGVNRLNYRRITKGMGAGDVQCLLGDQNIATSADRRVVIEVEYDKKGKVIHKKWNYVNGMDLGDCILEMFLSTEGF